MRCLKYVLLEHVTLFYVMTSEQCDKHVDSIPHEIALYSKPVCVTVSFIITVQCRKKFG